MRSPGANETQRHKGTKKAGIKIILNGGFLCAFVPLCFIRARAPSVEKLFIEAILFGKLLSR